METRVYTLKQRTCTSPVRPDSTAKPIVEIYVTVFNTIFRISITNQCFVKPLCEKTFPELSKGLSRHTLGPKLSLFSFPSVFFSVVLGAHMLYAIGPGCWMGPSVRPLLIMWPLICLDSVTNRGCGERRAERHPSQSRGNLAQFDRKGTKWNAGT